MFTIKKISRQNSDIDTIESSFRKYSIRKGKMIEFASKSAYQKIENKFFYANENDKYFEATRIKYPFENILPRLILKMDKRNFNTLNIRFSIISGTYFIFLYIIYYVF